MTAGLEGYGAVGVQEREVRGPVAVVLRLSLLLQRCMLHGIYHPYSGQQADIKDGHMCLDIDGLHASPFVECTSFGWVRNIRSRSRVEEFRP